MAEGIDVRVGRDGAKSYRVDNPADIQQVFLDAMVERQCRPNC